MATPDDTTGVPSHDKDAAAASSQLPNSPTDPPASDSTPPGEIPPNTALTIIEALTLANAFLKASGTTLPAPKVPQSNPETDRSASDAATAVDARKEKLLTLETKDRMEVIPTNKDLVVDISSEVTKFLPYNHEASSGWWTLGRLIELVLFLCLTGIFEGLLASEVLESYRVWDLEGWRVCLMIYLVFSWWIVAKWIVQMVGDLAEHPFLELIRDFQIKNTRSCYEESTSQLEIKTIEESKHLEVSKIKEQFDNVALVAQGMRASTAVFLWILSLLVAWNLLFRREKEVTRMPQNINQDLMNKVTRALTATLVGVFLWWLKTLLVQLLAWSFIVNKSEKQVKASCNNQQHIVDLWESTEPNSSHTKQQQPAPNNCSSARSKLSFRNWILVVLMDLVIGDDEGRSGSGGGGRKVLKQEYDAIKNDRRDWTPRYLIRKITERELPVFINAEKTEANSISVESVARSTADWLFGRMVKICRPSIEDAQVAQERYIDEHNAQDKITYKNLAEKLEKVIPLVPFCPHGYKRFRRSDFRNWMIKVYTERLVLIRAITGRDNVIGELNRILSCVAALIILFVWLIIMKWLTVQVMISIATFLGTLKFIFDDTARTTFEAIMFVFATRPFDVDNRCVVGKDEMVVYNMNILSTTFKRADGQKLYYPNSALIKKTITNCRSHQEDGADRVDFKVDAYIFEDDHLDKLRTEIEEYMEKENKIWNTEKCKMKVKKNESLLSLSIRHRANFYNGTDKKTQRKELVEKIETTIKKLCETRDHSVNVISSLSDKSTT